MRGRNGPRCLKILFFPASSVYVSFFPLIQESVSCIIVGEVHRGRGFMI